MPEIDLFAFLDGASPWWWVAAALVLGAVEMMTFTYFLIWLAFGSATVAVMLFVAPMTGGTAQIVVFALSGMIYALLGWAWLRYGGRADAPAGHGLNRRAARLVGRTAVVCAPFRAGIGQVEVDGVAWRAQLSPPEGEEMPVPRVGAILRVSGADGATLLVSPDR